MINLEELTIHEMNNLMDKGIISSYKAYNLNIKEESK